MELNELFDKLEDQYKELQKIIESQKQLIEENKRIERTLRTEIAVKEAEFVTLEKKWKQFEKLIVGMKQ